MQRQIGWAWSRRVLAFVIAAALVWALLLVVERQGGAQASPRAASQAQLFAPAAATAALGAANAQQAGLALGMARSAAANASALPPPALSPVCAALLRARAILVALGPAGAPGLAIIDALIASLGGCVGISGI